MDRKINNQKKNIKKVAFLGAASIFIILVIYSSFFKSRLSQLYIDPSKLIISTVTQGVFQETIPIQGTIKARETVYLDIPQRGKIEHVYVESGQHIKEGAPILTLSNPDLKIEYISAQNQFTKMNHNLRQAKLELELDRLASLSSIQELTYKIEKQKRKCLQNEKLIKSNVISYNEYETDKHEYEYLNKKLKIDKETHKKKAGLRQTEVDHLEKSVKNLQTNLELIKEKISALSVLAPVSGQITHLNAQMGQSKSSGDRIGQIDTKSGFKIQSHIDEYYLNRIHEGLNGLFKYSKKNYKVKIEKIFPEIQNGKFKIDMKFLDRPPANLKKGLALPVRLQLSQAKLALLLKRGAFSQDTGGHWVYVIDHKKNLAYKKSIKLGRKDADSFEINQGLTSGDQVITSTYQHFKEYDQLLFKPKLF